MEYQAGSTGRVFYVRFDHGEELFGGLKALINKENVRCGWFQLFGGILQADVVIGPKQPVVPPEPIWQEVAEAREVLATGSIFWDEKEPMLHVHAALGHHGDTVTGCVRKKAEVYLVVEAVIFEFVGMDITRPWYQEGGFNRPEIKDALTAPVPPVK